MAQFTTHADLGIIWKFLLTLPQALVLAECTDSGIGRNVVPVGFCGSCRMELDGEG